MGQISVNSVTSVPLPSASAVATPAVADRTLNRAVSVAVTQLNDAGYAGEGREVTFSVDRATRRPVIKVIDTVTKEVIRQWPPEYLLQIAAETTGDKRDSG